MSHGKRTLSDTAAIASKPLKPVNGNPCRTFANSGAAPENAVRQGRAMGHFQRQVGVGDSSLSSACAVAKGDCGE